MRYHRKVSLNGERHSMLSEKINSMKLNHHFQMERAVELLQSNANNLEIQLSNAENQFDQKCYQTNQIFRCVQEQFGQDIQCHNEKVHQAINHCDRVLNEVIGSHPLSQNKTSMTEMAKDRLENIKKIIKKQIDQSNLKATQFQESIASEINSVKNMIMQNDNIHAQNIQRIHNQFMQEYDCLKKSIQKMWEKKNNMQASFYKTIGEIAKKVNNEITEERTRRQNMEENVLSFIKDLSDRADHQV